MQTNEGDDESNKNTIKPNRNDTMRLTQEFNEKHFVDLKKLDITNFSVMCDDIRNFRTLTEDQLTQVETFTEKEKVELICLYNDMFVALENIIKKQ